MMEEMKKLTSSNIHEWLQTTDGHDARLRWWNCWHSASLLFRHIAEPLSLDACLGLHDIWYLVFTSSRNKAQAESSNYEKTQELPSAGKEGFSAQHRQIRKTPHTHIIINPKLFHTGFNY